MIEDCSEDIPYPHKEETPQKNKIEAAERIRIRRTGHRSHSDNCPAPPRFESEESSNKNTWRIAALPAGVAATARRSEEHTSELQSLMRISYAVFCLNKKKKPTSSYTHIHQPTVAITYTETSTIYSYTNIT